MNSVSNKNKLIHLRVTTEEYDYITQQANDMKLSANTYIKKRIFDNTGCRTQLDRIMQLIPVLHTTIDAVSDTSVRQELRELGGQICQCLK